jgi:hypothetical protein
MSKKIQEVDRMLMVRDRNARNIAERFQSNSILISPSTCNRRAGRKGAHRTLTTHHFYSINRKDPRLGHFCPRQTEFQYEKHTPFSMPAGFFDN